MNINPLGKQLLQPDTRPGARPGTQMQSPEFTLLLAQIVDAIGTLWASGTTAQRPKNPVLGQIYMDTTLGYPIYCNAVATHPQAGNATWVAL